MEKPTSLSLVKFVDVLEYIAYLEEQNEIKEDLEKEVKELEEAIKEADSENQTLSDDVSDLEERVEKLESELEETEDAVEKLSKSEAIIDALPNNLDITTEAKILEFIESLATR